MMLPATTAWLPNFFTPRRLLTLSRPFLTLPCPFLCAMSLLFLLGLGLLRFRGLPTETDAGDLHAGQFAPVTDSAVITLPAAILEGDDFLVLALLDYFAGDGRAFDERRAVRDLVAVTVKKDVGKDTFLPRFLIEEIDIDNVAFRDAMLSAASFDNCVSHTKSRVLLRVKSRAKFHRWAALTSAFYRLFAPLTIKVISPFGGCAS